MFPFHMKNIENIFILTFAYMSLFWWNVLCILKKNAVQFIQHEIFISEKYKWKNLLAAREFSMFVRLAKMFSEYCP